MGNVDLSILNDLTAFDWSSDDTDGDGGRSTEAEDDDSTLVTSTAQGSTCFGPNEPPDHGYNGMCTHRDYAYNLYPLPDINEENSFEA